MHMSPQCFVFSTLKKSPSFPALKAFMKQELRLEVGGRCPRNSVWLVCCSGGFVWFQEVVERLFACLLWFCFLSDVLLQLRLALNSVGMAKAGLELLVRLSPRPTCQNYEYPHDPCLKINLHTISMPQFKRKEEKMRTAPPPKKQTKTKNMSAMYPVNKMPSLHKEIFQSPLGIRKD